MSKKRTFYIRYTWQKPPTREYQEHLPVGIMQGITSPPGGCQARKTGAPCETFRVHLWHSSDCSVFELAEKNYERCLCASK